MLKMQKTWIHFFNTVKNQKIPGRKEANPFAGKLPHPVLKSIFKQLSPMDERFGFHVLVLMMDLRNQKKLNARKATRMNYFPVKILKQNVDTFTTNICNFFSFWVNEVKFANIFKQANITPTFKKGYWWSKDSYCPMNILRTIAWIIEKLLNKQGTIPCLWIKFFWNNTVLCKINLPKNTLMCFSEQLFSTIFLLCSTYFSVINSSQFSISFIFLILNNIVFATWMV